MSFDATSAGNGSLRQVLDGPGADTRALGLRTPLSVRRRTVLTTSVLVGILVYAVLVALLLQRPYEVGGGVLVAHLLVAVTVPALLRLTRNEGRWVRRVVLAAFAAKMVGTLVRFTVLFAVYGGRDAVRYDAAGKVIAESFRHGDFTIDIGRRIVGTGFIEVLTGAIYTLIGDTSFGGFLIYSWLGFWGLYLFYRAFRLALPHGDARRYALFVFFLPSMLFWPSSIGKDAWMTFSLGLVAYGVAGFVTHRRAASWWLGVGLLGTAMVRPHITLTVVVSLTVAYALAAGARTSLAAPLSKLAGLIVLVLVLVFVVASVKNFFKLDSVNSGAVDQVLTRTQERSAKGGSEFDPVGARSPAQLPLAVFSTLFRPLPFEAHNLQGFIASLEGSLLLLLFLRGWRRLGNVLLSRRLPYLAFAVTYSALFAIAFSNVGNFGLLARERVQLLPFIVVLLCVPARPRTTAVVRGPVTHRHLRRTAPLARPRRSVPA